MTESFVVYLLFVIVTFFRPDQQILGFATRDACLAARTQIQEQGAPDVSACIPFVIQGTPGTETPEDAAAMLQSPLQR
jgi:hypothetical protein